MEFKLAQKDKHDDPTCSSDDGSPQASGWCPKTFEANAKKAGRGPVEYKTDNKLDGDIITTQSNIKREEKNLGHDLTIGEEKPKKETAKADKKPADSQKVQLKDFIDDDADAEDREILDSIKQAENSLG